MLHHLDGMFISMQSKFAVNGMHVLKINANASEWRIGDRSYRGDQEGQNRIVTLGQAWDNIDEFFRVFEPSAAKSDSQE
jgi:hypothetical protein